MIFRNAHISPLIVIISLVTVLYSACQKEETEVFNDACTHSQLTKSCYSEEINSKGYDIFLIAGQSNTYAGKGYIRTLDSNHPRIKQLGRYRTSNYKILPAQEPLQHHTVSSKSKIGFALTFAKEYTCNLLASDRNVLLIPCGKGGSSFKNKSWNKGDPEYSDAIERVNYALTTFPGSKMAGILWHQGESDVGNPDFQANLDSMIINLRSDINSGECPPFILGGLLPGWAQLNPKRMVIDSIIKNTPERLEKVYYVNPSFPCELKSVSESDDLHFSASSQRELGRRYFEQYVLSR